MQLLIGGKVNRFVPNPTFDPIIVPGLPRPAVPRPDPRGRRSPHADAGRAAARRVPRPRHARRGDGRAGPRRRAAVPDARLRRRGGAARRRRRHDGEPLGVQPLARGGLGLRLPGPVSSPRRCCRSPIPTPRCAEVDSLLERGRADRARPAGAGAGPNGTSRSLGDTAPRSGLGPARRGVGPRRVPPRRQRLQRRFGRVGRGRGSSRASARATCSGRIARVRPRDPRHDRVARRSTACSSATRRCGSPASRTARTGCTSWPSGCASRPTRRRGCSPRTRSTRCAGTCGSTPYFEEDLAALAELIGVERILFGSDWPHGEGLAQPLDFAKELGGFDDADVQRIMRDNCVELLGAVTA